MDAESSYERLPLPLPTRSVPYSPLGAVASRHGTGGGESGGGCGSGRGGIGGGRGGGGGGGGGENFSDGNTTGLEAGAYTRSR